MLNGCGDVMDLDFVLEKARLFQEVDEAYYARDRISCVDAIVRLYELLDDTLVSPRCSRRQPSNELIAKLRVH